MGMTLEERFWSKVDVRGPNECWPWLAYCSKIGYGQFAQAHQHIVAAHRLAYELANGVNLAPGHCALHSCDNRKCCNPAHLFIGSRADNVADMVAKHRHIKGELKPAAKLTWPLVVAIRQLYAGGEILQQELADRFGVRNQIISGILSGKRWNPEKLFRFGGL